MSQLKVDRELFVTCRLCIEELGEYQIVPSVQLQIKQFFDIHVEPFDGLPQLICPKCNKILFEVNTIKTTFCEKQAILRKMVFEKDSQQDTVSSSQEAPETTEPHQPANHIVNELCNSKKRKPKRKRLLLHSSSSSDLESEQSFQTSKPLKKKSSRHRGKSPMPWEADYIKMLSCQLCNSFWLSRKALASHNRIHENLRERHKDTLNRPCTVNLIKIDDKPNITGLSKMVVHSSNKIVEPGNAYFYTIYSKEDSASTNHSENNCIKNEDENKSSSQESSDGEERIVFNPKQRKRRFISRSSNETVVIESNCNKVFSDDEDSKSTVRNSIDRPLNNNQCIKIDDSSDSESDQGRLDKSEKVKQPIKPKVDDYKNFQGIISMSLNSYHKKNESAEDDMLYMNVNQNKKKDNVMVSNESQLKHKVLSIGRKIINKQGFNCTGLLRYMEHKNLEVRWIDQAPSLHPKDTNYIRILTSLRGDLILDDEPAWVNVSEKSQLKPFKPETLKKAIKIAAPNRSLINISVCSDSTAANIVTNMVANIETSAPEQINNQAKLDSMPAMLSYLPDSKTSTSASKKLLNAYPVANPKKLPKKSGAGNESRSNKTVAQPSVVCLPTDDDDDNNYCLPIITSTTSLATIPSKERTQDITQKNASKEQTQNTSQKNASKAQTQDTNQKNGSKEQSLETNQKNASKEQTQDTNQNNASKEQTQDANQNNVSKGQTQDTNQRNASKAQTQDTNQRNASKAQTQDTNQRNASKAQTQDTNQRNASKAQTQDTNQKNASKELIQDTNQKNCVTSEEINKTETSVPRIKVKPVTELMSERTLDRMKEQEQSRNVTNNNMFVSRIENVWPHQQPINIYTPNIAPQTQMLVTSPQIQILQMPTLNAETAYQPMPGPITSNFKPEHVLLDTTEFPNTKTESPIMYVKDLLQLHNMFLLDPNVPLSNQFICLIKFKVVFKQDYQKDSPVILCLSLSCLKNTFCFQVRDRNQDIIDMTKISANWQWEILQTFHGDVSSKVLQNARKYGQETFDMTNKFFCLIKSIKCKKPC